MSIEARGAQTGPVRHLLGIDDLDRNSKRWPLGLEGPLQFGDLEKRRVLSGCQLLRTNRYRNDDSPELSL